MLLCLECGKEAPASYDGPDCPNCHATGIPVDTDKMLNMRTSWHELRILVIWAERWASAQKPEESEKMLRVIYRIAERIQMQHLDQGPLTFAQELADLRGQFGEVQQNVVREIPPEPPDASV